VRKILALAVVALTAQGPAHAQVNPREADPAVWLRQVYDLYHRAEKTDALLPKSADELFQKRASRSLAALFKREQGALDWDFVIDGQAWEISQVKVGAMQVAGDKATVTVSFVNLRTPCVNVYYFVREAGEWKVDDIETRPKGEKPIRIAKLLRDSKDYQE
jgi:hypothetical protein